MKHKSRFFPPGMWGGTKTFPGAKAKIVLALGPRSVQNAKWSGLVFIVG